MTTEDEARLAEIRERCKSPPWQEHDIGFLLRLLDAARARIAQLNADYVQAQKDANVMIDEREAKVKRLEAEVEALKRGFATPSSEASSSEGAHASVPDNAWDVIIRDRNEWKRRAGKAEAFIASIGQDSGVDFHDEIAHLRGEGPDPFAVPEVERWRKRSEAAELRLSQVENTIRVAVGRFEAVGREYRDQMFVWDEGGEALSALRELLVDLGFEPEPGR